MAEKAQQKKMVQSRCPVVFFLIRLIFIFFLNMQGLDTNLEKENSTVKKKGIPSLCSDAAQPQVIVASAHDANFLKSIYAFWRKSRNESNVDYQGKPAGREKGYTFLVQALHPIQQGYCPEEHKLLVQETVSPTQLKVILKHKKCTVEHSIAYTLLKGANVQPEEYSNRVNGCQGTSYMDTQNKNTYKVHF